MSTVVAKNLTVQNSAGTASTNISFDGTKLVSTQPFDGLGVGQTWQDVTASRAADVTYTNSTGKPILVSFTSATNFSGTTKVNILVSGVVINTLIGNIVSGNLPFDISFIVPNNATYSVITTAGAINNTETKWSELR